MQERNISSYNFEQCIKCTICTAYCPVVPVNPLYPGPKQAGPDGERLRLKNKFFFDENLKYCMNCKRCEVACPSGVHIADIIHSARARYSSHKPGLRDWVLANTDFMGRIVRPVAPAVNTILSSDFAKKTMDKVLRVDGHRVFPKYVSCGFSSLYKKAGSQENYKHHIAYFHGCSTEYQHPEVGLALVKVMNALGYGVELLDEVCCGVARISNGLWKAARKAAVHNISEMESAVNRGLPVITTASSCALTLRDEYPAILGVDNSRVRDSIVLVEKFIYELIDSGRARPAFRKDYKARIAYHVPCHLEKLGWSIFTVRLLRMIPGVELIRLDSNCCGMAGTYGFKKENYQYAQAIGLPLFRQIEAVAPDFVACECDTCKWQIEMSTPARVLNPILILAEALDPEATSCTT